MRRLRLRVFAIVALLTAGAVSFVGTIGFIGLVAPHIARMLVGDEQRFLPMAGLTGAGLLTGASILSKVLAPGVIPIGIVTAVIGVSFLLASSFGAAGAGRRRHLSLHKITVRYGRYGGRRQRRPAGRPGQRVDWPQWRRQIER